MASSQKDPGLMNIRNSNGNATADHNFGKMCVESYPTDMQLDTENVKPNTYSLMETSHNSTQGDMKKDSPDDTSNGNLTAIGAGPLPAGFGVQPPPNTGNTLTEFTKRRNWSQRVLEELKDMLHILTPDGRLLYVSPSVEPLTGHVPADLVGKFMSDFIHSDDSALFIREFNESIATGHSLRFFYRFRTSENMYRVFEAHGHPHLTSEASHQQMSNSGPVNAAGFCRGFFLMARPYPTKNTELLDSFLEHKIENERLRARIAALKREEAEEVASFSHHFHKTPNRNSTTGENNTPPYSADLTPRSPSIHSRDDGTDNNTMPPPAKPTLSNTALTREALDEANAFSRPDSITDKMARYEGTSHVDSIEMLTGLRYREGERAHGISTGGASPALIRGDAGIDIPADKPDPRYRDGGTYADGSRKPKKVKSADEYVCTDCGTLDSPEWRKGPMGAKTLCNACGLRWAKKEKKRTGVDDKTNGTGLGGVASDELQLQAQANSGIVGVPVAPFNPQADGQTD